MSHAPDASDNPVLDQVVRELDVILANAGVGVVFVKARTLRSAPAPLASNDLIILAVRANDDRLDDAALCDRISELGNRFFVKMTTRLSRMRGQRTNREQPNAGCR